MSVRTCACMDLCMNKCVRSTHTHTHMQEINISSRPRYMSTQFIKINLAQTNGMAMVTHVS